MKNKTLKQVIADELVSNKQLQKKIELFSNYIEHDAARPCYVMTTDSEIVICNEEFVSEWQEAGFSLYGIAHSEIELNKLIEKAEYEGNN